MREDIVSDLAVVHSANSPAAVSRTPSRGEEVILLLAGWEPDLRDTLATALSVQVLSAETAQETLDLLAREPVAVLCLGGRISGLDAARLLTEALERDPQSEQRHRRTHIVLAAGPQLELFQDFIDCDQLYYLSQRIPSNEAILQLLRHALQEAAAGILSEQGNEDGEVFEILERIAGEENRLLTADLAAEAVYGFLGAEQVRCLIYEPERDTLWWSSSRDGEQRDSASAGLVSFAVRTALPVHVERVGKDPRCDLEIDHPDGDPRSPFLAVPVITQRGEALRVLAVLVCVRASFDEPFTQLEIERLEWFARQLAPTFERQARKAQLETRTRRAGEGAVLFRQEALEHHQNGVAEEGHVLRLSPRWIPWAYRLLVVVFTSALLYACFGSVHEYAAGVAVVRAAGGHELTSTVAGTVKEVEVVPGQRVAPGQLLVRLDEAEELAGLERIRLEFEIALLQRLADPTDPVSERSLGTLAAQRRLAEARLEERSLRALKDGVVGDLRVRPGQPITPGQAVLTLRDGTPDLDLIALFPGHYRPLIEPGMALRLEIEGYRYAYQHLEVEHVGDQVLGPAEARRFLGAGIADAVALSGPVVFVTARLPSGIFESGGELYSYHGGIGGKAEIRVRSESILTTLLPGLKALVSDRHG